MIVYTLTANVDEDIAEEWLQWMKADALHFAMQTNLPLEYKIFKVLNDVEGVTYTFQLYFKDVFTYKQFLSDHHAAFSNIVNAKFTDKAVYFNTLLQQL